MLYSYWFANLLHDGITFCFIIIITYFFVIMMICLYAIPYIFLSGTVYNEEVWEQVLLSGLHWTHRESCCLPDSDCKCSLVRSFSLPPSLSSVRPLNRDLLCVFPISSGDNAVWGQTHIVTAGECVRSVTVDTYSSLAWSHFPQERKGRKHS